MWIVDFFAQCDDCGVVALIPGETKREAVSSFYEFGWCKHGSEMLCPDCAPKWRVSPSSAALRPKRDPHKAVDARLLALLTRNQRRIVSYESIANAVPELRTRPYLLSTVSKLRRRHKIATVAGEGYKYLGAKQ